MAYNYRLAKNNLKLASFRVFQSISLRLIASAPRYVTNKTVHKSFKIDTVDQLGKINFTKFHTKYIAPSKSSHFELILNRPPRKLHTSSRSEGFYPSISLPRQAITLLLYFSTLYTKLS